MKRALIATGLSIGLLLATITPSLFSKGTDDSEMMVLSALYQKDEAPLMTTLEKMQKDMGLITMKGSAGSYYVAAMIPYCRAGVELSRTVKSFNPDREIERLAGEMSLVDESYLRDLQRWHSQGDPGTLPLNRSSAQSFLRLMKEIRDSVREDTGPGFSAQALDPQQSFVTIMIAHKQGAVDMAKVVLIFEDDPELRRIAQSIISEQQRKLKSLQSWMKCRTALPIYR
jgi:uncharacterized protein (DUF305 family)